MDRLAAVAGRDPRGTLERPAGRPAGRRRTTRGGPRVGDGRRSWSPLPIAAGPRSRRGGIAHRDAAAAGAPAGPGSQRGTARGGDDRGRAPRGRPGFCSVPPVRTATSQRHRPPEPGPCARRHRKAGHSLVTQSPSTEQSPVADSAREALLGLRTEISKAVVGQEGVISGLVIALLCRGHVLLEGVPGVAKTLMVRTLAAALQLDFKRVQFTPDLMPGDVTGSLVYNARTAEFEFHSGPVFTNLLLADEINRTPPKTQAALLEAMEERQVSVEGQPR